MTTPEYAGFWRRTAAVFIDILWISGILFCCLSIITLYDQEIVEQILKNELQWYIILLNDALPAVLVIAFWISYAATPGKLLFNCKIVDADTNKPITIKQAFIRYIGYFLSILVIGLGFLAITWDKRKQGWHDKIANTVVVIHDESATPLSQLLEESR